MGQGQLAESFEPLADAIRKDGYEKVVSFESVHCDEKGSFEEAFADEVETLQEGLWLITNPSPSKPNR